MNRVPVVSSCVASIGYCATLNVLEVEFRRGGVYQYVGVMPEEHAALLASSSKGQHVNGVIKPRHAVRPVAVRT